MSALGYTLDYLAVTPGQVFGVYLNQHIERLRRGLGDDVDEKS